jgi:mannose-1-phosphate guanylyltransferase/phosphomannomutase
MRLKEENTWIFSQLGGFMRAVLMAGGSGTRLRPLTCDLPKPMVPILNRPIAEHIINLLKGHQIYEIIATLHYLPDILRDYFQDGSDFGVQMTYAIEEDQPLGTAGCVKNIAELLDETFSSTKTIKSDFNINPCA